MTTFVAVQGDITEQETDAIVNAANESLLGGGSVDGAIHRAAGPELLEETKKLGGCPTGEARITRGYALPAELVIHTVGPRYNDTDDAPSLLASCYRNALELARRNGVRTIAFPAISTGAYGYPFEEAAEIAVRSVRAYVEEHPHAFDEVRFVLLQEKQKDIYQKLLS